APSGGGSHLLVHSVLDQGRRRPRRRGGGFARDRQGQRREGDHGDQPRRNQSGGRGGLDNSQNEADLGGGDDEGQRGRLQQAGREGPPGADRAQVDRGRQAPDQ